MRLFSDKNRPTSMGPYPLERLARSNSMPDLSNVPSMHRVNFQQPDAPEHITNAMDEYQSMLDALRDGLVNKAPSLCPEDLTERADHLKGFGYFSDSSMIGCCAIPPSAHLSEPINNPSVNALAEDLRQKQTKTLASGIDLIMAELKASMDAPSSTITEHEHAIVILVEYPRDPTTEEPGSDWIQDAQAARACLRAAETAVVLANYLRLLGYPSRAHSGTCTDLNLNTLCIAAGLASIEGQQLHNPYVGNRFGLAAVSTTFAMAHDQPLQPQAQQNRSKTHGIAWQLGKGFAKSAFNQMQYKNRRYVDGAYPFESLNRVDNPTTYIDTERVARVPKRADMFARAQFGDLGKKVQAGAAGGYYVRKAAPSTAQRRALGAFVLIQNGEAAAEKAPSCDNPQRNAENIKAACYFLGVDAVGLSACPDWTYYSHNALGEPLQAYHPNAISIIIDQGYETMEGASGDDWISVAQSMRAYLRFSLLGGVIAKQLRNLGFSARAHTVMDGEVLQPPLLLLSGLGEVSRIGEVILNPFLGPRLKSGVVTTDMPFTHDKPIDFGLQDFCDRCQKCARECPSGAITAGPKHMFNGYEIWKSDSQKCATYRITTEGGAMCGRCMKTCPWNLEGLLGEKPFRALAMHYPKTAPWLEKLDDRVGNGGLNPVKKWWWDLEMQADGSYKATEKPINERHLQPTLRIDPKQQTMAVYPAPLAPPPYAYPYFMDREQGIKAHQSLISSEQYQQQLQQGDTSMVHHYIADKQSPVTRVVVSRVESMAKDIRKYELRSLDGSPLPAWKAGAHIDIVVAPEYLRQYSLSGNPQDTSIYQIAVLCEHQGKGGSALMHRIFTEGREIFIAKPINHFPLQAQATKSFLMGGGIGITPMLAMAHELHAQGAEFELHYSFHSREQAGFLNDLELVPWKNKVTLHCSTENNRADLKAILEGYQDGWHVYACGPATYIQAVIDTAKSNGFTDESYHCEYFSTPDTPEYINHNFTLHLQRSARDISVSAEQNASDALIKAGVPVDVKCADGLCGVCQCTVVSGEIEHRDFVLSQQQRENTIILCQSRAAKKDGIVVVDL